MWRKTENHLSFGVKQSKWTKDFHIKSETFETFRGQHRKNSSRGKEEVKTFWCSKKMISGFDRWDLMKFKSFCPAKETIIRMKTAYRIGNRNMCIFAYVSGQRLSSRIWKETHKLNDKENHPNQCIDKWIEQSSEEMYMANEHRKKSSIHLALREMRLKLHGDPIWSQSKCCHQWKQKWPPMLRRRQGEEPTLLVGI